MDRIYRMLGIVRWWFGRLTMSGEWAQHERETGLP